jgi:hypothetical protein
MGIEPTRTTLQSLRNAAFREALLPACDWRANFCVMRDNYRVCHRSSAVDPFVSAAAASTSETIAITSLSLVL